MPRIARGADATRARVQGLDGEVFRRAAQAPSEGCALSALIEASGTVAINAELDGGGDGD